MGTKRSIRKGLRHAGASLAVVATALLGTAGAASAGEITGTGLVQAKDAVHKTVTIGKRTFRVSEDTKLEDANGRTVTLDQVHVAAEESDGQQGTVLYEAHETTDGLVLDELRAIQSPR